MSGDPELEDLYLYDSPENSDLEPPRISDDGENQFDVPCPDDLESLADLEILKQEWGESQANGTKIPKSDIFRDSEVDLYT